MLPMYKKVDKTDCSNYRGMSLLSTMYKILSNTMLSKLTPNAEEIIGDINVDFDATGQLLITYSAFGKFLRRKWRCNESVYQLIIDLKRAYVFFMFEFPCIISLYYIKYQLDATLAVLFISNCKITLHVSNSFCVHHQ